MARKLVSMTPMQNDDIYVIPSKLRFRTLYWNLPGVPDDEPEEPVPRPGPSHWVPRERYKNRVQEVQETVVKPWEKAKARTPQDLENLMLPRPEFRTPKEANIPKLAVRLSHSDIWARMKSAPEIEEVPPRRSWRSLLKCLNWFRLCCRPRPSRRASKVGPGAD